MTPDQEAALLELKGLIMVGFHGHDGQRALEIVQQLLEPVVFRPVWPPAVSAIGLPEGHRRFGSTGQLFAVKGGRWERVLTP